MGKTALVLVAGGHHVAVTSANETKVDFSANAEISWGHEQKAREELLKLIPKPHRQQKNVCLVLSRTMFFSKQIRLPSVDENEIRKMLVLQISQHLPYPPEQAIWDFVICQRVGSSSDILVFSIQLENMMKYWRPLVGAGLTPSHVTLSSYIAGAISNFADNSASKAIFMFDETSSEFCFCSSDNNFYSSRGIVYGKNDFQTPRAKDFFNQARLTFESHRKNFPEIAVSTGYYTKGLSPDFVDALSHSSGIVWKELPLPAAMTPGAAFIRRGFDKTCNFLPAEYKTRHLAQADRKKILTLSALITGVIVTATLAVASPVLKKQAYARKLDGELERIANPYAKSQKERALLTAVTTTLNERISPLKLIEEIYNSTPPGVAFIRIQVSGVNQLELEGNAPVSTTVNDMQERMIASKLFRDVRLEHATRRGGANGEKVRFLISARLQN